MFAQMFFRGVSFLAGLYSDAGELLKARRSIIKTDVSTAKYLGQAKI
jgi:hypothetical protein